MVLAKMECSTGNFLWYNSLMKAVILSFVSAFAVVSVARAEGVVSAEGLALQGHCVVKFDDGEGLFNRRLGMFVH